LENALGPQRRRSFVRRFILLSVFSWIGGKKLESLFVADASAQSTNQIGIFRLSLDTVPALKMDNGSVIVRVPGMPTSFPQIIITRLAGNQFFAVTSRCPHQGCTVDTYDPGERALVCPCHLSRFRVDGTLINGPATVPLTAYRTTFDGSNTVAIEIPNLGYSVKILRAVGATLGSRRMKLEFPTLSGLRYEVRFRASLSGGAWVRVPFATTLNGAATLTVFNGTGSKATVYVDSEGREGFYAIIRS
jgi:Rieske Fe-S protein